MINAVANSTVPHIALMAGASYGAGNYGMSGRPFNPRFAFSWPTARVAVMGGTQLAGCSRSWRANPRRLRASRSDEDADAKMRQAIEAQIEAESTALFNTARIYDDGIIDPRDTRHVLGMALSVTHSAEVRGSRGYGVFRM